MKIVAVFCILFAILLTLLAVQGIFHLATHHGTLLDWDWIGVCCVGWTNAVLIAKRVVWTRK